MASKEVTLIRSFAYQDDEGKQHYFTRDNQDKILEIVGEANLQPYIDNGIIEVSSEETMAAVEAANKRSGGLKPAATTASAAAERRPVPRSTAVREG